MSGPAEQSGIELARRGMAAFSSGDWDATLETMHPEVEWHVAFPLPDLPPGKTVFRGPEEVRDLWNAFTSIWRTVTLEIEDVEGTSAGEDATRVVTRSRFKATGSVSGAEVDRVIHYVLDIDPETELLIRIRPFDTREEALGAAGIEAVD